MKCTLPIFSLKNNINTAYFIHDRFASGSAFIPEIKQSGGVDSVVIVMKFPGGQICTLDNHRKAFYGYDQRVEIHGSRGMLQLHNHPISSVTFSNSQGIRGDTLKDGMDRYADAYNSGVNHFIDLLTGKSTTPRSQGKDCLYNSLIAEAAMESLKSGKSINMAEFAAKFSI